MRKNHLRSNLNKNMFAGTGMFPSDCEAEHTWGADIYQDWEQNARSCHVVIEGDREEGEKWKDYCQRMSGKVVTYNIKKGNQNDR